jgi:hypothetical protein
MHDLPSASGQSTQCADFDDRVLSGAGAYAQSSRRLHGTVPLPANGSSESLNESVLPKAVATSELQRLLFCVAMGTSHETAWLI